MIENNVCCGWDLNPQPLDQQAIVLSPLSKMNEPDEDIGGSRTCGFLA